MKKILFVLLISLCAHFTYAQNVEIVNFDKLEQRFKEGKDTVYVVNFWATWCAPCVKEIPYFEQLGEKYKSNPLKVILVSLDFKSKIDRDLKPFIAKYNLKSEVFLNEKSDEAFINKVSEKWSGAIPATLIVNSSKNIRNFYEQEFSYKELENNYLKFK